MAMDNPERRSEIVMSLRMKAPSFVELGFGVVAGEAALEAGLET